MRQIGTIANSADLNRLTDYLLTLGIRTHVDSEPTGFALWAYDEDRIAEAKSEVASFLQQPTDPKYANAAKEAKRIRDAAARREKQARGRVVKMGERWNRPASSPFVTWILIALSIAAASATSMCKPFDDNVPRKQALAALIDPNPPLVQRLTIVRFVFTSDTGSLVESPLFRPTSSVARGEIWRLVTPIFLHFNIQHIVFNMLSMASIGKLLEGRYGRWWILLFVIVSAIVSNVTQYVLDGPTFGGMSGVVYALFGFAWIRGSYDPTAGFRLSSNSIFIMLLWLVVCMSGMVGAIANAAHFSGLLIGAAWGIVPVWFRRLRR